MNCIELNDNDIAMVVDWVIGMGKKPPPRIMNHLQACFECKVEVLEIAEVLDEVDKAKGSNPSQRCQKT